MTNRPIFPFLYCPGSTPIFESAAANHSSFSAWAADAIHHVIRVDDGSMDQKLIQYRRLRPNRYNTVKKTISLPSDVARDLDAACGPNREWSRSEIIRMCLTLYATAALRGGMIGTRALGAMPLKFRAEFPASLIEYLEPSSDHVESAIRSMVETTLRREAWRKGRDDSDMMGFAIRMETMLASRQGKPMRGVHIDTRSFRIPLEALVTLLGYRYSSYASVIEALGAVALYRDKVSLKARR